jgi:PAP2 superfamily
MAEKLQSAQDRLAIVASGGALLYATLILSSGRVPLADFWHMFSLYLLSSYGVLFLLCCAGTIALLGREIHGSHKESRPIAPARRLLSHWLATRRTEGRLLIFFTPPFILATVVTAYNCFKDLILGSQPFRFDPAFQAADKLLFLGHDPWRVTHALLSQPWMTRAMDIIYYSWFVPMALCLLLCSFSSAKGSRLQAQYIFGYLFVWIGLGTLGAWLFPSAGPCFYTDFVGPSANYTELLKVMHGIDGRLGGDVLQALIKQDYLRQAFHAREIVIGGGISAMPSVHNALASLFALAAFGVHRKLGWLVSAYAALIWVGSIHLGWHYAVDGLVSVAATIAFWRVSGRLADWIAQTRPNTGLICTA